MLKLILWNPLHLFQDTLIKKIKRSYNIDVNLCYNIDVFIVPFYQFNVSLLSESIHLFKKSLTEPTFERYCEYILDFTSVIIKII